MRGNPCASAIWRQASYSGSSRRRPPYSITFTCSGPYAVSMVSGQRRAVTRSTSVHLTPRVVESSNNRASSPPLAASGAVIAPLAAKDGLLARLFDDSTTLGVRCTEVERVTARRWPETIETAYGPLQVKVMEYGGRRRLLPEYEACRQMAEAQGLPLIEVYRLVPRE